MLTSTLNKISSRITFSEKIQSIISTFFCMIFRLHKGSLWSSVIAKSLSELTVTISDKTSFYKFVSSNPLLLWRARTLLTKEEETIHWLNQITSKDILFDVGANIGVYTIFAANKAGKVFSFEPESSNYATLNKNIHKNNLQNVSSFGIAIADKETFDILNLGSICTGAAHHSFGAPLDYKDEAFSPAFKQGCFSTTLDNLTGKHGFPIPTYLKIDVDGLEAQIITGAEKLLENRSLKSILIELNRNLPRDLELIEKIESKGFKFTLKGESSLGVSNYIFSRQ